MNANQIIAKAPQWVRDDARYACCIPMNDAGYQQLLSREFIAFFRGEPQGATDQYEWHTVRVDQLCNLRS